MKRIKLITGAAILGMALTSGTWAAQSSSVQAQQSPSARAGQTSSTMKSSLARSDQQFLQKAASNNAAEIQMCKIAEQNSSDPNIKNLAKSLQKDHTQANQQLRRLAASKGIALNFQPTSSQQRHLQDLSKKQGQAFDKEFLSLNTKGHEQNIALYQKEGARAQDPDVKSWANKMLPDLRSHLAMVRRTTPQAVGERVKPQTSPQIRKEHKHHRQMESQPSSGTSRSSY